MNIYIYENQSALDFDPISLTRATFDIRIGTGTFLERIQSIFPNANISLFVREELMAVTAEKHSNCTVNPNSVEEGLWLLGNVIWDKTATELNQKNDSVFHFGNKIVGANLSKEDGNEWIQKGGPIHINPPLKNKIELNVVHCQYLWNILDQISETLSLESQHYNNIDASKYW